MADIDKGLPNTRTEVEVPGEEVEVKEEIKQQPPVEVTPEEDGGATIDFEPGAINIPGTESHFDNLADILPDDVLNPLGSELKQITWTTRCLEKIGKNLIQMDLTY